MGALISLFVSLIMMMVSLTFSLLMTTINLMASLLTRSTARPARRGSRSGSHIGGIAVAVIVLLILLGSYPQLAILLVVAGIVVWLLRKRSGRYRTPTAQELARMYQGVRLMSGQQFEVFVANLFRSMGHEATVLGGSGDQGVDVILASGAERIAVQCKNYQKPVGNKPVQEVYAGAAHHGCQHAWVVAPAGFTRGAFELAGSVGVSLFDDNGIRAWIKEADRIAEPEAPHAGTQTEEDAEAPASGGKVSTINGQVVSDQEAYDALLESYEKNLDVLEQLYATRRENKTAYKVEHSLGEQWSKTYEQIHGGVEDVVEKLDVLEGRNPSLAGEERVARRADLASRQLEIESGEASTKVDFADQIRKLAELRDEGVITDEEFEAKKNDLLDRM